MTDKITPDHKELTKHPEESFEIRLLDVAQILHNHGNRLAIGIISHYHQQAQLVDQMPRRDQVVGIFDHERMTQIKGESINFAHEPKPRIQITIFIGPKTTDQLIYTEYPRVSFYYKGDFNNPGKVESTGCQVGLRGFMEGPRHILEKARVMGKVNPDLLNTKVNMEHVVSALQPYMLPEQNLLLK